MRGIRTTGPLSSGCARSLPMLLTTLVLLLLFLSLLMLLTLLLLLPLLLLLVLLLLLPLLLLLVLPLLVPLLLVVLLLLLLLLLVLLLLFLVLRTEGVVRSLLGLRVRCVIVIVILTLTFIFLGLVALVGLVTLVLVIGMVIREVLPETRRIRCELSSRGEVIILVRADVSMILKMGVEVVFISRSVVPSGGRILSELHWLAWNLWGCLSITSNDRTV